MYFIKSNAVKDAIRQELYMGKDYTVVPIIALKEQVLNCSNCPNPEFISAEAMMPAASWNGRPVTLDHPHTEDGEMMSANSPQMMEQFAVGFMFNTELKDNSLHTEAWLENDRLAMLGDKGQSLLDRLDAGEPIEVSTGYFADIRDHEGIHDNVQYKGIQHNIKPDHLAILNAGDTGACSWENGCGVRTNSRDDAAYRTNCGCGGMSANNSASEEEIYLNGKYPDSETFADPKDHKYPLTKDGKPSKERIEAAWKYIHMPKNQKGYTPAEVKAIERRIIRAWKAHIDPKGPPSARGNSVMREVVEALSGLKDGAVNIVFNMINPEEDPDMFRTNKSAADEAKERENTLRSNLKEKLKKFKSNKFTDEDIDKMDLKMLEATAALVEEAPAPAVTTTGSGATTGDPANAAPTEAEVAAAQAVLERAKTANGSTTTAAATVTAEPGKPKTTEEYLKDAPEEVKQVMNKAMNAEKAHRQELIGKLKDNKKLGLTEAQLKERTTADLELLVNAVADPSHIGGAPVARQNIGELTEANDQVTPPTLSVTELLRSNAQNNPRMKMFVPAPASAAK